MAFEAWGGTREETFVSAADATIRVMAEALDAIEPVERRSIAVDSDTLDMLLFGLLQELLYYKDAQRLLLRVKHLRIGGSEGALRLSADAAGEIIDPLRHGLHVDVKAVTLHRFAVEETPQGWRATVILDI